MGATTATRVRTGGGESKTNYSDQKERGGKRFSPHTHRRAGESREKQMKKRLPQRQGKTYCNQNTGTSHYPCRRQAGARNKEPNIASRAGRWETVRGSGSGERSAHVFINCTNPCPSQMQLNMHHEGLCLMMSHEACPVLWKIGLIIREMRP